MKVRNQVHLIWAPGHKGVAANELADELARSAAALTMIGPESCYPNMGITICANCRFCNMEPETP